MQLKNNNPVAMEKRTDLASLFCMIGRHGPAVAVAVIAMVSVVAGFIIYRSVKGKRRKAEAGAGDVGSSPAARQDASLPQLKKEPSPECDARSPVESTDVGEAVPKARVAGGTRSRRRQRNGRGAAEKNTLSSSPPKREVEPEKLCNASHVEETSGIPLNVEGDVKTLQDDGSEAKALEFQQDYFSSPHTPHSNSAEGGCSSCFEPVEVHESFGNEEKVRTSLEDEVPCQEEGNPCSLNSPVCHDENAPVGLNGDEKPNDQVASDSISTEGYFEKPTLHKHESLLSTEKERGSSVIDTSGFSQSHTANLATENIPLHNPADDQPLTVTSPTTPANNGADAKQSPNGEETEHNSLGEILVNCAVLQSSKELELEQDASTCSKENIEDVKHSSFETQETSALVSSPVIPCSSLSVKPETIQEDQVLPSAGLNQELKIEDDITTELVNKSAAPIDLACPESETVTEILIPKENAKILLSSGDGEPNAVGSEASSDASASTEMSLPDDSSFQNQSEQLQNAEDREVPNASAPIMAESIEPEIGKDQLLHENQSKLTWCLPDVGEESGISSMTVSPDLPDDGECSFTHENVLLTGVDDHPQSEDQAELQTAMGESPSVIVEDPADATLDSSNDAQRHSDINEANALCTVHETLHHGIERFNTAGQLSKAAPTDICASEDLGKMESKIVIKGELEEESKEEDTTTEINIMEATMDHNEWITDGTDQDHPWVKPSIASVPQINPVSPEECIQSSFPVDTTCRNADVPPVNEDEQLNTVPSTDEPTETGKRVLAVQPMPQNVSVTFRIHYLTHSPYQKVAITGNRWELGNWKDFIPLEKAKDGLWATVVSLPAERHVEWKFVVMDRGEVCRWEECGNRFLDTGNGENLLVHKCWGLL